MQNLEALTCTEFDIVGTLGSHLSKSIGSVFSQLGQGGINNVSAPSFSDWEDLIKKWILQDLFWHLTEICKIILMAFWFWWITSYLLLLGQLHWTFKNHATSIILPILFKAAAVSCHCQYLFCPNVLFEIVMISIIWEFFIILVSIEKVLSWAEIKPSYFPEHHFKSSPTFPLI